MGNEGGCTLILTIFAVLVLKCLRIMKEDSLRVFTFELMTEYPGQLIYVAYRR